MSKVKIQGNASGTGVVTLTAPNTNTDRTITLPDGDISLGVGIDDNATSTAITIDASERVGFSTTSPQALTHIYANNATVYDATATDGQRGTGATLFIENDANSNSSYSQIALQARTGYEYCRIVATGGSAPDLAFVVNNAERMRIDSAGNVEVKTGNLVIGTSGKGIDFSADGNAGGMTSEVLDDYEEGTWTPTPNDGWGALTLSGTGTYTKVGNVVHLSAFFVVNGSGTGSGDVNIQGLPFTSNSNSNFNPAVAIHANKLNSAVPGCVTGFVYHNLNRIYIRESGTTSDGGDLGVHFDSGSDLYISTTYTI
jgi:hypothetical protein